MKKMYMNIPVEYISKLINGNNRSKARCFMEYYYDMENDEINSVEFYRISWGLTSKGSTHKWIGEFKSEIEKYHNFMILKNNAHYNSVKNSSERKVNANLPTHRENKPSSERKVNEDLNIIDIDKETKNRFRTIFSLFGFFRMSGKESEALEAFLNVDDIEFDNLVYSVRMFLQDTTITHKQWMPNFLKEKKYVNYMKQTLAILRNGKWITGEYNSENETFITPTQKYNLSKSRMLELLDKQELKFSIGAVA
ncbi:MAG: hypothetical protein PHI02_04325 [Sulfurovaceae bacterium]|nr:hypothetical protein [Sulfurovaceae bacterium]